MTRGAALLWLAVVVLAGAYLAVRVAAGLTFQTDLTALLPHDEQDPAWQKATDALTRGFAGRVIFLVGDSDAGAARTAATALMDRLRTEGIAQPIPTSLGASQVQRLGALYFPYRAGLLSDADRAALQQGHADAIALRALSQVFGFVGLADGRLLRQDPFLLLPAFFAGLPVPYAKLSPDRGMLSVTGDGAHWVFLAVRVAGDPYELAVQRKLDQAITGVMAAQRAIHPTLRLLRLGAPFFAQAGAEAAMRETSTIGLLSTLGTILVVLVAYRALAPLWLSLLVIGVGVMTALSASLALFGTLHVGALLFGVSLIGVAVDYSLQYCTEMFATPAPPRERLRRVLMGISLGTATTVIGYLTLLLAPFPGLHQIAAFSAIGLVAAWLTVVLWLPALDRGRPARHGQRMLRAASACLDFWEAPRGRRGRVLLLGGLALAGVIGLPRFHADDDIRRMQSLSADLLAQQHRIQALIGGGTGTQVFLVRAPDTETALRREEALADRLRPLIATHALGGFQALAEYVPSAERQRENRALVRDRLGGAVLARQMARLNLPTAPDPPNPDAPVLTPHDIAAPDGPLGFLSLLVLSDTPGAVLHVVTLDGVADPVRVAAAANGLAGVRFVDPAGDFSRLLGKYRDRALLLLALSAALMLPLLVWRYGPRCGPWVMLPPLLAVLLTVPLRALGGAGFSFFDAMALVLVLSIGVDYAVFCAESRGARRPVTMLAVGLAAGTALMSFGLLALSGVVAVNHFGATMLVGISLSLLFAPIAGRGPGAQ